VWWLVATVGRSLLETNKQAFVDSFVNRPAFVGVYGNMDNSAFVDTLISHTGVSFTSGERDGSAGVGTAAQALPTRESRSPMLRSKRYEISAR
jgi:hypothetical protein